MLCAFLQTSVEIIELGVSDTGDVHSLAPTHVLDAPSLSSSLQLSSTRTSITVSCSDTMSGIQGKIPKNISSLDNLKQEIQLVSLVSHVCVLLAI